MKKAILYIFFLLLLFSQTNGFSASRKFALVIGNSAYKDVPLRSPVNDAIALSKTLEKLGFSVVKKTNITQREMEDAIRAFAERLHADDIALFYFSGHGVQVNGVNYLVPIGEDIRSADEVKYKTVEAEMIMSKLETAGSRLNIIILDACRNNPFKGFRSTSGGLAQMTAPAGTLIAYATSPGDVAYDGDETYSPYTTHLLKTMVIPGLDVEKVFKQVRIAVMKDTAQQQVPWESSSLTGDFYFTSPLPPTPTPKPKPITAEQPIKPMRLPTNRLPAVATPEIFRITKIILRDDAENILYPTKEGKYLVRVNKPVRIWIEVSSSSTRESIGITWTSGQGRLLPLIDSQTNTYIATQKGSDDIVVIVWDKETGQELKYTIAVEAVNRH